MPALKSSGSGLDNRVSSKTDVALSLSQESSLKVSTRGDSVPVSANYSRRAAAERPGTGGGSRVRSKNNPIRQLDEVSSAVNSDECFRPFFISRKPIGNYQGFPDSRRCLSVSDPQHYHNLASDDSSLRRFPFPRRMHTFRKEDRR
ncbi:hypothetical protein Zmor_012567 [Zophobas morio]|uniref:Uncharacterized protein n=1 Tax=Zophobas morio TaxID=2755281 RepID=A0AA38I943_9CUCU|nr:hypothetical protein Zmor_012567 [Zophobas morio]